MTAKMTNRKINDDGDNENWMGRRMTQRECHHLTKSDNLRMIKPTYFQALYESRYSTCKAMMMCISRGSRTKKSV